MAHTPRRSNDKRKHSVVYPPGTRIGMRANGLIVTGKINTVDAGGWIYPIWDGDDLTLPGYCRSTHVFPLDGMTKPTKKFLVN